MQFGNAVDQIDHIDFTLPPDTTGTRQMLEAGKYAGDLQIYVGAAKWGEKTWKGRIYPRQTPDGALLPIYCRNFNCVEFGPTFYSTPSADDIAKWVGQVTEAPAFKFCPKFPQMVSHIRRLSNAGEPTARFYQSLTAFGNHLGPLMLQLADNFTPKNFPQLKAYLEALPPAIPVHVEVRHRDWFAVPSYRDHLFSLLRNLGVGTVISDVSGRRDCVHMELTNGSAIIRFVGNNLAPSDYSRLDEWVERIAIWKSMGLKSLWFFMHQNDERHVPEACDYLIKKLNLRLGTNLAGPKFIPKDPAPGLQGSEGTL